MSSRDIRERDRRAAAPLPSNSNSSSVRTNEYFVPKDGIDREVITADICRYLGNDALVRPGNYEDPQTRQVRQGYFITAYRNLTTAMIADLKADSDRWDTERRATASRGQPTNVGYRDSTTHQSRQYYGPTEQVPGGASSYASTPTSASQGVYDSGSQSQYQQGQYANQPANTGYTQPGYPVQDNNYYTAGADFVADPRSRVPVQPGVGVPRSQQYAAPQSSYQQPDLRSYHPGQAPGQVQQQQSGYPTQPNDPYYGRGQVFPVTAAAYDSQDAFDNSRQYQQETYSSQAPLASSSSTPATSNTSSRRERERDPEPRDRHHRRR